jgi:voltage-gated potassium channel
MVIGTMGYYTIEDFTLIDAMYQTGITFTTVGFGEMAPISNVGRMFTITLIIMGFGVFSFAIAILAEVVNKGELLKLYKERKMLYKVARLTDHYVLCYHNEYTIQLSKQFRENHVPFVVIDPREDLEEIAREHKYPYFIQDEPHTQNALLKSHFSSAKGMITISKNIADNIATIATARLYEAELNRKPYFIISNAETQSDLEKLKKLGADSVVSPTKLMAQRVNAMASKPDMQNLLEQVMYKKDTPLDIEEVTIKKESWLVLKRIRNTHLRDALNVSIVGMSQVDGKFVPMPRGSTIITSESKLLLIGGPSDIMKAKKMMNETVQPKEMKYV